MRAISDVVLDSANQTLFVGQMALVTANITLQGINPDGITVILNATNGPNTGVFHRCTQARCKSCANGSRQRYSSYRGWLCEGTVPLSLCDLSCSRDLPCSSC